MNSRALLAALGVSLLFNVFVLVGFARARAHHPDRLMNDSRMIERMVRDLNLNEQQRNVLVSLRENQRNQAQEFDESLALIRENLDAELRNPSPDLERIRALVAEEAELYRQRRMAGANMFGRFLSELTPDQRQKLRDVTRPPHRELPKLGPKVVERFDANRNGRLDPDEARAARQEMERRRQQMHRDGLGAPPAPGSPPPHSSPSPPAPPYWRQFDADGDSKLDEQELGRMEQARRQRWQESARD
jgi:Spy/CpxP family protein refolding chaperone